MMDREAIMMIEDDELLAELWGYAVVIRRAALYAEANRTF